MEFFDDLKAASFAGSGGSPAPQPTLITKSVVANGTYSASDDSADGYSSVVVDVPSDTILICSSSFERVMFFLLFFQDEIYGAARFSRTHGM
jgi:hypothetical protein